MRRFQLDRKTPAGRDGDRGIGIVAEGVVFTDGAVAFRWRGGIPSTVIFRQMSDVEFINRDQWHTEIVWLDE